MKKKHLKILKFKKSENFSYKRKIIIKDLVFNTFIGIHDFEKTKKQQIKFNLEIEISKDLKPNDHDLNSVLNYENVIELIKKTTNSYHHNLLETLAEEIFDNLFKNKSINKIKLKIEKPDVIKNTSSVGIEITKKRK